MAKTRRENKSVESRKSKKCTDKTHNPTRISKFESLYDDTVEYFDDNESDDEEKDEDASDSDDTVEYFEDNESDDEDEDEDASDSDDSEDTTDEDEPTPKKKKKKF